MVYFRLDDVKAKCGPDAYSYLNLLWHLVVLLTAFTLFSVSVILPINYNVGDQRELIIYTVCILNTACTHFICICSHILNL